MRLEHLEARLTMVEAAPVEPDEGAEMRLDDLEARLTMAEAMFVEPELEIRDGDLIIM